MTIYIVLYLILLLTSTVDIFPEIEKKNKLYILFICVVVLTLFRGLRWQTGTDWDQFYYCFENVEWSNLTSYDRYGDGTERMEVGYMVLNRVIRIFGDYTLFLILTNLFLVGTWAILSYKLVPQKPIMTFSLIVVSNMFFPVRLQLAVGFFVWALYALYKKKFIMAFLIAFLSYYIHKSAILMLPFLFILTKNIKPIYLLLFTFMSLLGNVLSFYLSSLIVELSLFISLVDPNLASNLLGYSDYEIAGGSEKSMISIIVSFLFSLLLMILFIYSRRLLYISVLKRQSPFSDIRKFNIFLNSFLIFTIAYKFFSAPMLANFQRISEFFTLGCPICFMMTYSLLEKKLSQNILFPIFALFFLYKFKSLLNTPYPDLMFPYVSVFSSGGMVVR